MFLTSPFVTGFGQSWSQRVTVKLAPQRLVAVTGLANKPTLLQWQTHFVNTTKQVCYLYQNPLCYNNKHTFVVNTTKQVSYQHLAGSQNHFASEVNLVWASAYQHALVSSTEQTMYVVHLTRTACGPDGVEPKGDKCHGYVSGILEVLCYMR
jgi:hypothetical protein